MSETPASSSQTHWGRERRLAFIDFRLLWERRLNRRDLKDFFGISTPQASADIQAYRRAAPKNMVYDASQKTYVATDDFEPAFVSGNASSYLGELQDVSTGHTAKNASFIGFAPDFGALPIPRRNVDRPTLIAILEAIREQRALEFLYQSMSSPEPSWRWISPHALASNGQRFHIRAYCHKRESFRDFVLSRVLEVGRYSGTRVTAEDDIDWSRRVTVRFAAHPELTEGQRRAIEREYDMDKGEKRVTVRAALAFYLLQRLNLDAESEKRSPVARQIVLLNPDELHEFRGSSL
ncbi:helix-turn-helix transcriptional regulator [Spiribacter halobius]|nr:WYL domain-containing protein [Spiribacter halobius]UEX77629.1 WYL domain-containing protein [Spiribacter halobius]